jgi:hypothetical protein
VFEITVLISTLFSGVVQNYNCRYLLFGMGTELVLSRKSEEHRLSVSENKLWRRIFGPQRDEVTGE